MPRAIAILAAVLLLVATPTWGAGINLFWNDCSAGLNPTTNHAFACNTNVGRHELVASFDPPPGLTAVTGAIGIVDLWFAGVPVPPWWQFASGGCRLGALGASTIFTVDPLACFDYWQGQANAVPYYQVGYQGWDSARIIVDVSMSPQYAGPVEAGSEYYAFKITIRNTDTVGSGSCAGCNNPACIVLNEIKLVQPQGTPGGSPVIMNPLMNNYAHWQTFVTGCPFVIPVENRTWGQVKSLYR